MAAQPFDHALQQLDPPPVAASNHLSKLAQKGHPLSIPPAMVRELVVAAHVVEMELLVAKKWEEANPLS